MLSLKEIGKMLESNNNLNIDLNDSKLIITEKGHVGIEDLEISKFIKVFDKESEIKSEDGKIIVATTALSAQRLMLILMSVYKTDYDFEVTAGYTLEMTKKTSNESNDSDADKKDDSETEKTSDDEKDSDDADKKTSDDDSKKKAESLMDIAEAIDNNELSISVNKNSLIIESNNDLMSIAESIDSKFKDVNISVSLENLTIKLGDE